uniref:Uncharacterized protein n=1 Tax=Rhizophora mucronata TaxID=61149 RepID=A0A2P2IYT7_RHIMU
MRVTSDNSPTLSSLQSSSLIPSELLLLIAASKQ